MKSALVRIQDGHIQKVFLRETEGESGNILKVKKKRLGWGEEEEGKGGQI